MCSGFLYSMCSGFLYSMCSGFLYSMCSGGSYSVVRSDCSVSQMSCFNLILNTLYMYSSVSCILSYVDIVS